jgi:hypothetical protein
MWVHDSDLGNTTLFTIEGISKKLKMASLMYATELIYPRKRHYKRYY